MSDDQYARAGRAMFLITWIILFGLLFVFFHYYGQSENTIIKVNHSEFILSADQEGHYRIKGQINDSPVQFLVDTGATFVAIPQNIADSLQISGRYPITINTANGQVTGSLTRLKKLSFGEFHLNDVKAVIIPHNDDMVLLGMNVLSQFNMMQENKQLILKRINPEVR